MLHRLLSRALSFGLAAVITAGMLGGIDHLSQREDSASGGAWAQAAQPRA